MEEKEKVKINIKTSDPSMGQITKWMQKPTTQTGTHHTYGSLNARSRNYPTARYIGQGPRTWNNSHNFATLADEENGGEYPVRIVNLGWVEQVWENMSFLEYRGDIVVIDMGMLMPWDEMFWVDYIIPDVSYLKAKKDKIRWIIITHGHLDHIGAVRHILQDLDYPLVYATPLAIGLMKKMIEWTEAARYAKFSVIDPEVDIIKLGQFSIEFFWVNHSIPESMWLAIHTPKGLMLHTWDFKIDFTPAVDKPADLAKIARIWKEGVRLMFSDSTNAGRPWRTPSEKSIWESLEQVIKESDSRLIIATFSSLIWRLKQIIDYCVKYNKIVFLSGRSMVNNIEVAKNLGYINVPNWMIRNLTADVESMPDNRVVILTTWSQGEEFAALARIARWEHPHIKVRQGDRILLSASPIAWNERTVHNMINELVKKWADVVTNKDLDLHVSGHGYQDDLKLMLTLVNPEFFVPVHWELYMRNNHKKLAMEIGMAEENVGLVDNGQIIEMYSDKVVVTPKKLKLDTVMIDGLGIGHLSWEYVMKARQIMAEDWIVMLIFKIDSETKELVWNIQIESRGFVYSSEVKKVHTNIVDFARKKYYDLQRQRFDIKEIFRVIKDDLGEYLQKSVGRVPMVVPTFVYINKDNYWKITDWMDENDAVIGMTLSEQGELD